MPPARLTDVGQRRRFRTTILVVEVLRSALQHDVEPADIQPAVIPAMPMRAKYRTLLPKGAMTMSTTHGRMADGTPITDEMVDVIADEAERGYDVEQILHGRRGGRPPMGSAASSVESVRLDPELKRDLLLRAAEEHISVSEAIRRAISRYLHAS